MRKLILALVPTVLAATTVTASLDSKKSPVEFDRVMTSAAKSFEQQDYLATGDFLRRALEVANAQLQVAVSARMPSPPAGMQPVERLARRALAGARGASEGPIGSLIVRPVERSFRDPDSGSYLRVRVQPNDPRATKVKKQLADENTATRFESQDRPFVIEKLGQVGFTVRTVLADRHMFEVIWQNVDEETMLLWVRDVKLAGVEQALVGQR